LEIYLVLFNNILYIFIYLLSFIYIYIFVLESASLWVSTGVAAICYEGNFCSLTSAVTSQKTSTISLEFNGAEKTLHFFVDGKQLPHRITNFDVTSPSFAISADKGAPFSVEVVSYVLLKKAGVDSSIQSSEYKCGEGRRGES
jgi:hypothetical protein